MTVTNSYEITSVDRTALDKFCSALPIGLTWEIIDEQDDECPPYVHIFSTVDYSTVMIIQPDTMMGKGWCRHSDEPIRLWHPTIESALQGGA